MGLRAAWVLPDGTRVAVNPVTGREWSVRVNDVEVANDAVRVSGSVDCDVRFRLLCGQAATARLRHFSGISVWELCTREGSVLYSGKGGFQCPSCRNSVASYATECGACGAEQPSNDVRVTGWLRSSIVRSIALTNLLFVMIGIQRIATYRKGAGAALASLQRARIESQFPGQFDTSTSSGFHAGSLALLQTQLAGLAMCMVLVFGVTLLAYRAPVTAASLKLALIAGVFLVALNSLAQMNLVLFVFFALLAWSAAVTLKAATVLRARTKLG